MSIHAHKTNKPLNQKRTLTHTARQKKQKTILKHPTKTNNLTKITNKKEKKTTTHDETKHANTHIYKIE